MEWRIVFGLSRGEEHHLILAKFSHCNRALNGSRGLLGSGACKRPRTGTGASAGNSASTVDLSGAGSSEEPAPRRLSLSTYGEHMDARAPLMWDT